MRLFKMRVPDEAIVMKEAEEAVSEAQRINKRVERIVEEYRRTEGALVDYTKTRRGINHA